MKTNNFQKYEWMIEGKFHWLTLESFRDLMNTTSNYDDMHYNNIL